MLKFYSCQSLQVSSHFQLSEHIATFSKKSCTSHEHYKQRLDNFKKNFFVRQFWQLWNIKYGVCDLMQLAWHYNSCHGYSYTFRIWIYTACLESELWSWSKISHLPSYNCFQTCLAFMFQNSPCPLYWFHESLYRVNLYRSSKVRRQDCHQVLVSDFLKVLQENIHESILLNADFHQLPLKHSHAHT